ncbi:MAG: hypothetical protein Fur0037_27900 [Planctomycetota bacterium]
MPELRLLPGPFRFALFCLVLVFGFGLATGAWHLVLHHEGRDGKAGFSIGDVVGAYAGIRVEAPIGKALGRGHPEGLPPAEKDALSRWLSSDSLDRGYDDERLGELSPAWILDRRCLSCHSRQAKRGGSIGKDMPFDYWDDVKIAALSRTVEPTAVPIVVASAHTHALAMGSLTAVVLLLSLGTGFSRRLIGAIAAGSGVGLLIDLACWLPSRELPWLVPVMVGAGGLWFSCSALLLAAIAVELLSPSRRSGGSADRDREAPARGERKG